MGMTTGLTLWSVVLRSARGDWKARSDLMTLDSLSVGVDDRKFTADRHRLHRWIAPTQSRRVNHSQMYSLRTTIKRKVYSS